MTANLDANTAVQTGLALLTAVGLKILGGVVLWIVGRWLIRLASGLAARALDREHLDPTIVVYVRSGLGVLLNIVLVVALLGFFGVQTATFAALLAGVGIAIGAAWSGLLSNFAAGVFLVMLRPFRVGDVVAAGGVTGAVEAIGLFGTTLNTADNVRTTVGNAKILGDTIQNYSANPYRRVDLTAQLPHDADPDEAAALLREALAGMPGVLAEPAPEVGIVSFTASGPLLAVRPYCATAGYWQVYFEANRLIRRTLAQAGYAVPEQHHALRGSLEMRPQDSLRATA